ncbi:uncharacterized protein F5Z01DRAFT_668662 [Emericellopsis atlantica]|uniref:Uncharacterized protein n=1 Tax=Emericellopsis atlantica TaxID=2614577 RepID=A0A9P7ZCY9_9HYPO|nr:uncharacterized protein F5Z01DRAFT_668662 [Emericellopsis atlantica]KAG9249641.1 hypothetical protein F5Z01DRAFT_668662 [Emericellopsis atlantica]
MAQSARATFREPPARFPPSRRGHVSRHYQQHVECREPCVFCGRMQITVRKFIRHQEQHADEQDTLKMYYAKAMVNRLTSKSQKAYRASRQTLPNDVSNGRAGPSQASLPLEVSETMSPSAPFGDDPVFYGAGMFNIDNCLNFNAGASGPNPMPAMSHEAISDLAPHNSAVPTSQDATRTLSLGPFPSHPPCQSSSITDQPTSEMTQVGSWRTCFNSIIQRTEADQQGNTSGQHQPQVQRQQPQWQQPPFTLYPISNPRMVPDVVQFCIFSKWKDVSYSYKTQWAGIDSLPRQYDRILGLFHFSRGPTLRVHAEFFYPTATEYKRIWGKTYNGWVCLEGPAARLRGCQHLLEYIQRNSSACIQEMEDSLMIKLWDLARTERFSLLSKAFHLWTANRLLMKGWQCYQTPLVEDFDHPYFDQRPAPRVLQNQLDQHLEAYVADQERGIVGRIKSALSDFDKDRTDGFFATLVLLSVLEKDSWRLIYWVKYFSPTYQWRHPLTPEQLIDRSVNYARLLLAQLRNNRSTPPELAGLCDLG